MRKKESKKLRLSTETVVRLDLAKVSGGTSSSWWFCEPVTAAFTGCEYCTRAGGCQDIQYAI